MPQTEYFFQLEIKQMEAPQGQDGKVFIEGMASTNELDRHYDIVEPGAFKKALTRYMKLGTLLRSHDDDQPCGRVVKAKITSDGLWIRAEVTEERTKADVLAERMGAFSIGYIPKEWEVLNPQGEPFNPDKDSYWDPENIRVLKELDLAEISIVSVPANAGAIFTLAKSLKQANNENAALIMKSMHKDKKKNIPANEVIEAEKKEAAEETTKQADEKTGTEEETAAEGAQKKTEEVETSTDSQEESENAVEATAAEEEGGETNTEESKGDEPVEEGDEETSEEKALLVLDGETMKSFVLFEKAGIARLAEKGEQVTEMTKEVKEALIQSQFVIDELQMAVKRYQEGVKNLPVKRALAPEGQLKAVMPENGDEGTKEKTNERPRVSKAFSGMFPKSAIRR